MRRFRNVTALAVTAGSIALVVAGCGGGGESGTSADAGGGDAGQKQVRIAAFLLASANAYAQKNLEGVQQAAKEAGNVTVKAFDGAFDGRKQLNQIEDAVASGNFDAFVIFPNDGAQVAPGAEEAIKAGIKVSAAYAPIGPDIDSSDPQIDGLVSTVWHPNRPNGTDLAKMTIDACAKEHPDANPCKVAYISGGNEVAFEKAKLDEIKRVLAAADRPIKLVSVQEGGFLQDPSLKATENILQANKDLDVITTSGDQMTLGAEQAVKDAGRKGITLIGDGASVQGVEAVKAKRWFGTAVYLPIDEGKLAAQMVIDAVRGKEPANRAVNVLDHSPIGNVLTQLTEKPFEAQWSA